MPVENSRRFSAFYPTNDFWFWVIEHPPWEENSQPDQNTRRAFMQRVVWQSQQAFGDLGVCADGLFFIGAPNAVGDPLAVDLNNLNAMNLLFISALRTQQRIDAGLEWISRTSRIRGYDPTTGLGGTGAIHSGHWQTLRDRFSSDFFQRTVLLRHFVERETMDHWLRAVTQVFSEPSRVRLLSEYALAVSLFHDHNFAGALIHAWIVSEHIFSTRWLVQNPLGDVRTAAGRKIGDLRSHLGTMLYSDLESLRQTRNELAHSVGNASAVSADQANLAFTVADRLIDSEWDLSLNLGGRGLTY